MRGNAVDPTPPPELLPRLKEYMRNFPQKTYNAENVSLDLRQKYIEYSQLKLKSFSSMVSDALAQLQLKDAPAVPSSTLESDVKSTEEITVVREMKKATRKRTKGTVKTPKSVPANDEVELSSGEDEALDKTFEQIKPTNRANRFLTNLYSNGKAATSSPADTASTQSPTINAQSASLKRKRNRNEPAAAPSNERSGKAPRGLGSVTSLTVQPRQSNVRFSDLGGCATQFLEVCQLAMHLKRPKTCGVLPVDPPKGFLVHGPPGCGKTMFAQAVAGEFNVPLIQLAATELVSGVSGDTEEKIRQLFELAKKSAPCIVVLDDIDSIAPRRETATREMERRVVNQLSSSLDDLFEARKETDGVADQLKFDDNGDVTILDDGPSSSCSPIGGVLVIGTTSRPDAVDGSLRRAGRFDCEISLGIPDEAARKQILEAICKLPLAEDVELKIIARLTPGYVGADLKALIREASKCAVNRIFDNLVHRDTSKRRMTYSEVEEELSKVLAWLNGDDDPTVLETLGGFQLKLRDFERALENVQPSAKREGFATVPDVTWDDIGALREVRNELEWSILFPVKRPDDYALLGISAKPQGILLCGPPGCGKTLLAKAVANETGMNFISVKGPELLNMYVGESERGVRTVFQRARDSSPCVIFFDEIDALCPKRSQNETSGSARLVNQLLTEMDGVEGRKQVFLIGATNRPDIVDPAILRPGRLDKILFVDFPSPADMKDILLKSTKNGTKPKLADDVDLDALSQMPEMSGFTGADLAALVHEASIVALKERLFNDDRSIDSVNMAHFRKAVVSIRPSVTETDRKRYLRMRELYCANKKGTTPSTSVAPVDAVVGMES